MTIPDYSSHYELERHFVEGLRASYEDEGYVFEAFPDATRLPAFLRSYLPDALATKQGQNIAIEVKRRPSSQAELSLQRIRRLFEGHPDWQLRVIFMGSDPLQSVTIPVAKPAMVRRGMDDVEAMLKSGHHRAAFVMAWSLLEAALGVVNSEGSSRPRLPGTIVQTLAMNGLIEPDLELRLNALIELRNRIVHGDLGADPSPIDIETVLSGVEAVLGARSP